MPNLRERSRWLQLILVGAYVYYCWSVSRSLSTEVDDERARAELYYRVSRVCYRIAGWFGSVGIDAETKAYKILDDGRMN